MVSEEGLLTCSRGRSFDDLLRETIDDVLKQVFGAEPAKIILQHVRKSGSLEGAENLRSAEVFAGALREVLGAGVGPVENLILKSLCSTLELEFERKEGYGFPDHVKELRERCGC